MITDLDKSVVAKVRQLYRDDQLAQKLFDWTAQRERDASSTSLETLSRQLEVSRGEAVALCRRLGETDCGEFIVGRRGQKSRFVWAYSCISLGKAASGESSELEVAQSPSLDSDEEESAGRTELKESKISTITINEAKAALAASLGVSVSNIEIVIRS